MRRALVSCGCVLVLGCSLVKNADDVVVGPGISDSLVADADDAADGADAAPIIDTAPEVAVDAPDASLDAADGADALVDRTWALWPMPSPTPASYDTSIADVVIDGVTKLHWQKVGSPTKTSFADAVKACGELKLEGKTDWRLPTRIELVSLLTFAPGVVPAINGAKFPGTPSSKHWTKSPTALGIFVVDFGKGLVGFDVETSLLDFRCVRSP